MRFYNEQRQFYCGVDLHARTMYLWILDQAGDTVLHRNIKARPAPLLRAIDEAPRRSLQRRTLFVRMHDQLAVLREHHAPGVTRARDAAAAVRRQAAEAPVAGRRDWPFPLYPKAMIDALADEICGQRVGSVGSR